MGRYLVASILLAVQATYVSACFPDLLTDWLEVSSICGTRPLFDSRPQTRVFNGQDAPLGAWPWLGQIVNAPNGCLLTIFSDQWGLTFPLCLRRPGNYSVVFGEVERFGESFKYRQEVGIEKVITHPDLIPFVQYNLALVRLAAPVNFTDYVRPVCINQYADEWDVYSNCWVAGFGRVNNVDPLPETLQEARVELITPDECSKQHERIHEYHDSDICGRSGGNGEPRACREDSAGPLICSEDGGKHWNLVGLFMAGFGRCENNTSVYTRLSNQTDFLGEMIVKYEGCAEPEMRCNNWETNPICVFEEEICDGVEHCPEGEDEMNCTTSGLETTPAPITCTNTTCANGGTCMDTDDGVTCMCSEPWTGDTCAEVDCGGDISIALDETVELTSPFYPSEYPNQLTCEWKVSVPDGYRLLVEFKDFQLEDGFDFIYMDEEKYSFGSPKSFISENNTVDVTFETDPGTMDVGFLLKMTPVGKDVDECQWEPCNNNGTCTDTDDGFSCTCSGIFEGRLCTSIVENAFCGEPEFTLNPDEARNLTSFNYPGFNPYQGVYSCKWIVTAPEGMHVQVDVVDIKIWPVRDTLTLNKNAVVSAPYSYTSESNVLEMNFFTLGPAPGYETLVFKAVLHTYLPPDGDECASAPCQNGGRCYDQENGFVCKCKRGFTGRTCQNGLTPCGPDTFRCSNGRCIRASYVCDKRNHCGDASDERGCDCEFNCYNGKCLPSRFVCDKNNNCGDWTDEYRPECQIASP